MRLCWKCGSCWIVSGLVDLLLLCSWYETKKGMSIHSSRELHIGCGVEEGYSGYALSIFVFSRVLSLLPPAMFYMLCGNCWFVPSAMEDVIR